MIAKIIILLIFLTVSAFGGNNFQDKIYLVIAQSQKGKSSFVKDITGLDIKIGKFAEGHSCTSQIKCYKSQKFLKGSIFIDTVGLYGTDLNTKESLLTSLEWYLINNNLGKEISGVILIQSYMGDTTSLTKGFQFISQVFGKRLPESIAIFMTKKNMVVHDEEYCQERRLSIEVEASRLGIPIKNILDIQTTYKFQSNIDKEEEQVEKIQQILSSLQPIKLNSIQQKKEAIEDRALHIQLRGKQIRSKNQAYISEQFVWGFIGQFFDWKQKVRRTKLVEYLQFPPMEQCMTKAKEIYLQNIRSKIILNDL